MNISGETLRIWRTMKKMKQSVVAKNINISQQEYSKWENKYVLTETCLSRFILATNCSRQELEAIERMHNPDKLTQLLIRAKLMDHYGQLSNNKGGD